MHENGLVGVCNCSMFCCTFLRVHFSIAIILMGKRELVALLNLSSWCLVMVERLFLAVPRGCLRFVIVVIPDHTHLLFLSITYHVLHFRHRHCPLVTHISNYIWSIHVVQIKIRNGIPVKYIIYYNLDTEDLHLTVLSG